MAPPKASALVLYPSPLPGTTTFNMSYYLSTHMPLVMKHWGPIGALSYTVTQLSKDAPYQVAAQILFESEEKMAECLKSEGTKEVMGDVGNFSSGGEPVFCMGEVVGSG